MTKINLIKLALQKLGITALNEMQQTALEASEKNRDIILLSPTGSGKTLAFLLPLLEQLHPDRKEIQALILTPSRELALQIEQVFRSLGSGYSVGCCYGGHSVLTERKMLENCPALLIGTPGRIVDHIRQESFSTAGIHTLILDEFDKSLEFGFTEEMSFIISELKGLKKRVLLSATEPDEIPAFTGIIRPLRLDFLTEKKVIEGLKIRKVVSPEKDKLNTLFRLICHIGSHSTLVFCNHRESVERVGEFLQKKGLACELFHGGMEQPDREKSLFMFRNGSCYLLVSTDLASRGLDIPEIENVVHYHLPANEEAFVHRNGRTARMFAGGTSFVILHEEDKIPDFLPADYPEERLPERNKIPDKPSWATLYIGKGKKEKLSKGDIAGFLMQKGGLQKDELGCIEVKEHFSYAAVKETKINELIVRIKNEKIKGIKTRFERAR
ncbi:MAG: DEAD/DEAH box helicase [Prevotellaceae bacterium]|jgi:superfamily II DNA/RNA helicase|nr:DEAD/DEAH box helicase [Prevotellaceae bacterium]